VAALVAGILVAYLALFPGAFGAAMALLVRRLGPGALLLAPAVWVTTELGRTYLWDGFPWALLGYSQVTVLPVAQLASLVGVFGLSALVAGVGGAAAYLVVAAGKRRLVPMAVAVSIVAGIGAWGAARIARQTLVLGGEPIRVAVVQGNIAQDDKWNPELRGVIMDRYLALSRDAIGRGARFVLWPESSVPFYYEVEHALGEPIRRLARQAGVWFLVGSDQVEPVGLVRDPAQAGETRFYNAAFLVTPGGQTEAVYRKMHLVPFGEYVPLKRLLFFVDPLVEAVSDFTPGREPVLLPVAGHHASTAICYEVIYPRLMRSFVQRGSELLTTITNDAWYGWSSAAYQHFEQAAMRAIEEGRFLARAANTGVSGFVDPYGRVLERTRLFETAVLVRELRFTQARTLYSRIGDLAAYVCLALTLAAIGAAASSARRSARTPGRSET
jgi:apolipoprotein N-acyltransferase